MQPLAKRHAAIFEYFETPPDTAVIGRHALERNYAVGNAAYLQIATACSKVVEKKRRAPTTRKELLTLVAVAYPLLAHEPALGRAMVDAFTWVDAQLRDS